MTTAVVNVRGRLAELQADPRFVYVGRAMPRFRLRASPFANPFRIGKDGTRDVVMAKYPPWLLAQPDLVERARRELAGKVLGCWCKNTGEATPCHADVLAEVANGAPFPACRAVP